MMLIKLVLKHQSSTLALLPDDPKFLDRQIWANTVEEQSDRGLPDSIILSASSKHITLTVKPNFSNFRIITAILSGVQIFVVLHQVI